MEISMQFIPRTLRIFIFFAFAIFLIRCERSNPDQAAQNPANYKEPLIKANQETLKLENQQIDDFIRRHKWSMETTSTGIRFMYLKHGIGPETEPGRTVKLSYALTLLNGDTVYTAFKDGPLVFIVGKGQVITGLEEAILLMRVGDHVKIIIPSHLAYGLIGDQKKILQKASLVYDMEFISMY
jgi:FKBP-type peptidyl-prolyl cis-trans isomerase FkpA